MRHGIAPLVLYQVVINRNLSDFILSTNAKFREENLLLLDGIQAVIIALGEKNIIMKKCNNDKYT